MDYKTKVAVIKALQFNLRNENSKVKLPKAMYAEALADWPSVIATR